MKRLRKRNQVDASKKDSEARQAIYATIYSLAADLAALRYDCEQQTVELLKAVLGINIQLDRLCEILEDYARLEGPGQGDSGVRP